MSRDVGSLLQLVLGKLRHILQMEVVRPLLDALGVVLGVLIVGGLLIDLKKLKTCSHKFLAELFRPFLQLIII